MSTRRFLSDLGIIALHCTASAGLLLCLCFGFTDRPLLAVLAGIACAVSILGFRKLEPEGPTSK